MLINTSFFSKSLCTSFLQHGLHAGPDPTPTKPTRVVCANLVQMHRTLRVRITEECRFLGRSSLKFRPSNTKLHSKMPDVHLNPHCDGPWHSLGIQCCTSVLPTLVLLWFNPAGSQAPHSHSLTLPKPFLGWGKESEKNESLWFEIKTVS